MRIQLFTRFGEAIGRLLGRGANERPHYCYPCPVCNLLYDRWIKPQNDLPFSYDICPCCFTEFGYDDSSRSHEELRQEWINGGMRWECAIEPPPRDWNPVAQLNRLYLSDRDFATFVAACEDDTAEPSEKLKQLFSNP